MNNPVKTLHNVCGTIINDTNSDDYAKALAQVALGMWDVSVVPTIVLLSHNTRGQHARQLRRIYRKLIERN